MATDEPAAVPDPRLGPDGTRKKDLRYTEHGQHNVHVDRQLDGSGHLARGDRTHMSVLNFSARAQPRTERDPEFAFRPEPASRSAATPPQAASEPARSERPGLPATDLEPPEGSVLAKIKKILGF